MNELSKEKTMTIKEVAHVLKVSERVVQLATKKLFPEIVKNGHTTLLREEEVTIIKKELESHHNLEGRFEVKTELEKDLIIFQGMQILQDRIRILTEQKEQAEKQVKMLVHDFNKTYTSTEIAKELNLKSAYQLNDILASNKIQYKQNGTWVLYSDYSDKGYTSIKETVLDSGKIVYDRLWTGTGRQFIINHFGVMQ